MTEVLNTHSLGHFGEMSLDYSDYRNVNIYYLLGITPSVVIITDWLKMEVSYICVGHSEVYDLVLCIFITIA